MMTRRLAPICFSIALAGACTNDWATYRADRGSATDAAVGESADGATGDDAAVSAAQLDGTVAANDAAPASDAGVDARCAGQCTGGTCSPLGDSFECSCGEGYVTATDRKSCQDIDECASAACPPEYPCIQTQPPGYTCVGRWADWPMPENESSAQTKPKLSAGPPPGVVSDEVTGLWWQQGYSNAPVMFGQANAVCNQLGLANQHDWRLPSLVELLSIADHAAFQPAVDEAAFPDTPGAFFWTSTPISDAPGVHMAIAFHDGDATGSGGTDTGYVRCVRTGRAPSPGNPAQRFRANPATSSVTDRRTGLEWEVATQVDDPAWKFSDAQSRCSSVGMRLPTVNELATILDLSVAAPYVDKALFGATAAARYWASTPYVEPGSTVCPPSACGWTVDFGTADITNGWSRTTDSALVRCVR
jgi:Protein of unknown function (DUF1566)/Complement Clr-like EGF-like